ncbi:hypothetical protein D3C72_2394070 [compost metagenome]
MNVVADVDGDIVVVDWIGNFPVVFGVTILHLFYLDQTSIGYIHHLFWDSDGNQHTIHFIGLMVFVWPPNASS